MEFKWSALGNPLRKAHYEKLSRFVSENLKISNVVQLLEPQEETFASELEIQLKTMQSVRFDFPFPRIVFKSFEKFPADLMFLRSADCAIRENSEWWLRSLLTESVRRLIIHSHLNFDLSGKAVVVGTGAGARASVMALVKIGLEHINVVGIDKMAFDVLLQDFKRFCFNVDLKYIPAENIKLLGREHTILINTTPLGPENSLLEDLTFFNYLTEGAFIIDLNLDSGDNPLVKEAQSLGKPVFNGFDVMLLKDLYWLEVAFGQKVDFETFKEFFKA